MWEERKAVSACVDIVLVRVTANATWEPPRRRKHNMLGEPLRDALTLGGG